MQEIWKPIPGYVDRYEVSSLGRVRSCCRGEYRILRPHTNTEGYARCILFSGSGARPDGKNFGKCHSVHRLMWHAFFGPIPKGMGVDRIDNSRRYAINNLQLLTQAENKTKAAEAARRRKRKWALERSA